MLRRRALLRSGGLRHFLRAESPDSAKRCSAFVLSPATRMKGEATTEQLRAVMIRIRGRRGLVAIWSRWT